MNQLNINSQENSFTKPLFSIVIPTYNHALYIGKALDSVINQSYPHWEAIIINNFSSDNTVEIVNQFNDSRIRLVDFKNNGIIAASRNYGIKLAFGEWICFLDSDDFWYPNKLELTLQFVENYDLIYHCLTLYDLNYKSIGTLKTRSLKTRNTYRDLFFNGNGLANSGVAVKKELIEKVGGFSEDKKLNTVEDYDLWLRLSFISTRFYYISNPLGGYLVTGKNMSSNVLKTIETEAYLIEKHKSNFNNIDFERLKSRYYYFWGRRHYLFLKDYTGALGYFRRFKGSKDFNSKIKSIINIGIIYFKKYKKNYFYSRLS